MPMLDSFRIGPFPHVRDCSHSWTTDNAGPSSPEHGPIHMIQRTEGEDLRWKVPTPSIKVAKRRVSFNRLVTVRVALHRNDYSDDESRAVWYSQAEMGRIYGDAKKIVKKINRGYPLDELEMSSVRGLECRTIRENVKRMESRNLARIVVRDEQERQWKHGIERPELLAAAYCTVTSQAQIQAVRRGRLDELVAIMTQ